MVILHGLLGMSDNWHPVATALSRDFYVVVPDLRNHGRSPHAPHCTYSEMAEDVAELMAGEEVQSWAVVGHSMGGKVAMWLALGGWGQRLWGLVAVDVAPRSYSEMPLHRKILEEMNRTGEFHSRQELIEYFTGLTGSRRIAQFVSKNYEQVRRGVFRPKSNVEVLVRELQQLGSEDFSWAEGRQWNGPALFVVGQRSAYVTAKDRERVRHFFPRALFATIKGAGHWVHADAPRQFIEVVGGFLRRAKTAGVWGVCSGSLRG